MHTSESPTFGSLLVLGATGVVGLAGAWLLLIGAVAVVEARTSGRWALLRWTGCPVAWRHRLLGLLVPVLAPGAGLGAAPALASPADAGRHDPANASAVARAVVGLPLPDRQPAPRPGHSSTHRSDRTGLRRALVVVRPGDTLWAIAARTLPEGVPPGAVARRCAAIYRANHALVGDDPDLIHPGQHLRVPVPPTSVRPDALPAADPEENS